MEDRQAAGTVLKSGVGGPFRKGDRTRVWGRYIVSVFFILAGANHFLSPEWYLENQMPPWLPFPSAALIISGIAEMLGGAGMLIPQTRRWAGWGLIALLIAVFPGNIHMASQAMSASGWSGETIGLLIRLPLQAVFIVGVLWVSGESTQAS